VVALEHFKNNASKYSLIIPDVKMPSTNGSELAKHAKKIKPDIRVMVMTAFEVDRELRSALPCIERNGFLQKPFHMADVCLAVKRHLAAATYENIINQKTLLTTFLDKPKVFREVRKAAWISIWTLAGIGAGEKIVSTLTRSLTLVADGLDSPTRWLRLLFGLE
jgi:DNA-binding NtrC family response regulator